MTTLRQLRKAALDLPGTEEEAHRPTVSFTVRGKGFASVDKEGRVLLQMSDADAEAALAEHPQGERLVRRGTPIGYAVPLAEINGMVLNALVHQAWRHRAPKRLVAGQEAADRGEGAGDLPTAIGRPATRALLGAGITTLDEVAARSQADLIALHGVGPRAVRVLGEALADRGVDWPVR